jgi:hypothetical protein
MYNQSFGKFLRKSNQNQNPTSLHAMRRVLSGLPALRHHTPCIRFAAQRRPVLASQWTRNSSRFRAKRSAIAPRGIREYARQVPVPQTKSISQTEYELRRTLLVDRLPEGSVCVLIGAGIKYASDSVLYASYRKP